MKLGGREERTMAVFPATDMASCNLDEAENGRVRVQRATAWRRASTRETAADRNMAGRLHVGQKPVELAAAILSSVLFCSNARTVQCYPPS